MKTLYIANIPATDFCYNYYHLCEDNKEILARNGLHYLYTHVDRYGISSHQYLANLLSKIANKTSPDASGTLKKRLQKFEQWAAKQPEDILLCFAIGKKVLFLLCQILSSQSFPTLSEYKIKIIYIVCPQDEAFEGSLRFSGNTQNIEKIKNAYIKTTRMFPEILYTESQKITGTPPQTLLIDKSCQVDAVQFFKAFDRILPEENLIPLQKTILYDRHAVTFLHTLEPAFVLEDGPSFQHITRVLQQAEGQEGSDTHCWASPRILQEIRDASFKGNQSFANLVFQREELFPSQDTLSPHWKPYISLPRKHYIRLLDTVMQKDTQLCQQLKQAYSYRWPYASLPPEGKQFFEDPNTPQTLSQEPFLSVLTLTRDHSSMLIENIRSVIEQKVSFTLQHIIVDDASTDDTAEIIKRYAARYPHIKPILLRNKSIRGENVRALFEQCRSKYAVLCDGDDYFTDPDKLQTQVDFMERNPDCALCFHPVSVVYEDGSPTKTYPPANLLPGGERLWYTLQDLLVSNFIQTNSVMYRWRFQSGLPDWFDPTLIPGDWYWHLLHAETGKIAYLRKPMSAYRRHAASLYALAEKDHVAHRHQHGMEELHTYSVCNAHFGNRYYQDFSRLARGVFADFVQDFLKTKDDSLLQKGIAAAPDFARDFLSLLASQNMRLPSSRR